MNDSVSGGPVIDAAHEDEQGQRLPGPRGGAGGGVAPAAPVKSPLDVGATSDIISASGLGAQHNLNKSQFPELPEEEPEEGAAEGTAGAEGAAAGAADLAPLAALL